MSTSPEIFARMTPETVTNTLESIARRIKHAQDEQWSDSELKAMHDHLDVLHLRQIADWLEAQQKEQAQ